MAPTFRLVDLPQVEELLRMIEEFYDERVAWLRLWLLISGGQLVLRC